MQCEQVWIAVRDGTRLAADLYLPNAAVSAPALLEALPYRKDDLTSESHAEDYLRLRGVPARRARNRVVGRAGHR